MAVTMSGNLINVQPGDPAFNVMTNLCDYFRLGQEEGDDIWLEGQIIVGEFVFNGRLYLENGTMGTVIDNFPKGPVAEGWSQVRHQNLDGYKLIDKNGDTIFSYHTVDNVCFVDVNLHRSNGELAVHAGQGGIVAHVPVELGRNGIVVG